MQESISDMESSWYNVDVPDKEVELGEIHREES